MKTLTGKKMHKLEPSNYQKKDVESGWLWKCCAQNITLYKDSDGPNYVSETRIFFNYTA